MASMKARAELIYNANAGRCAVRREMGYVADYLERHGWAVTIHETGAPLEATALARRAAARGADVVIAAGGDGTVNEVASGLAHTDTALGVLPVGTTNVWALQMRIPALNPLGPTPGLARWMSTLEEQMDYILPVNHYRRGRSSWNLLPLCPFMWTTSRLPRRLSRSA